MKTWVVFRTVCFEFSWLRGPCIRQWLAIQESRDVCLVRSLLLPNVDHILIGRSGYQPYGAQRQIKSRLLHV